MGSKSDIGEVLVPTVERPIQYRPFACLAPRVASPSEDTIHSTGRHMSQQSATVEHEIGLVWRRLAINIDQ